MFGIGLTARSKGDGSWRFAPYLEALIIFPAGVDVSEQEGVDLGRVRVPSYEAFGRPSWAVFGVIMSGGRRCVDETEFGHFTRNVP